MDSRVSQHELASVYSVSIRRVLELVFQPDCCRTLDSSYQKRHVRELTHARWWMVAIPIGFVFFDSESAEHRDVAGRVSTKAATILNVVP